MYKAKQPNVMFTDKIMGLLVSQGDIQSPISLKTKS